MEQRLEYTKMDIFGNINKEEEETETMIPYGSAYINSSGHTVGHRIVFNPYEFKKGKNKGKVQCYYRKGSKFKKIILDNDDIKLLEEEEIGE